MALLPRKEIKTLEEPISIKNQTDGFKSLSLSDPTTVTPKNTNSTKPVQNLAIFDKSLTGLPESATVKNLIESAKSTEHIVESTTSSNLADRKSVDTSEVLPGSIKLEQLSQNVEQFATTEHVSEPTINLVDQKNVELENSTISELTTSKSLIQSEKQRNSETIETSTIFIPVKDIIDRNDDSILSSTPSNEQSTAHQSLVNKIGSENLLEVTTTGNISKSSEDLENVSSSVNPIESSTLQSLINQKSDIETDSSISQLITSTTLQNLVDQKPNARKTSVSEINIGAKNTLTEIETKLRSYEEKLLEKLRKAEINAENELKAEKVEALEEITDAKEKLKLEVANAVKNIKEVGKKAEAQLKKEESRILSSLTKVEIKLKSEKTESMATTNEGVKTLIPIINEKVNQKNETQRKSVVVDVSNSTNVAQNITVNGTKLENLVDLGKNATTSAPVTEKPDKKHDPQRNSSVLEFSNSTVVSQNITENGTKTENHLKKVLDNLVDLGKNATTSAPVTTEKPNSKSETRKSTVVDVSNSTNVPLNITANGTKTENQLKKENSSVLANLVGLGVNATTSITVTTEKPNRKNETQRTSSVVAVSNGTNISQNITGNGTKAENQLKKEKPSVQKNLADLLKNSTTAAPVSTTEKPNRRSEAQRKSLVIVVPDTVNSHENEKKSLENDSKKDEEIKRIEKVAEKLELTAESLAKTQEKLKPQPRYINSKDLLKTVARAGRFSKVYPAIVVDNGNGEKDILIEDELGVRASVFLKSDLAKLIADKQISKILDHEKKNNDGLY